MQATRTIGGPRISKAMAAAATAVVAAALLGGAGGYLVKGMTVGLAPARPNVNGSQSGATSWGADYYNRAQRSGLQTGDAPAGTPAPAPVRIPTRPDQWI